MFSELVLFSALLSTGALWMWRSAARARDAALAALAASQADAATLAAGQSQLRELIAMLPVALFVKDAESRFVMMNAACETVFGVEFSKLVGTRGTEHYPAEQQAGFLEADRTAFATRKLWTYEEWIWHAGHRKDRRLLTYKQPLYDAEGEPALLIGMCVDVTERRAAEHALQDSLRQLRELSDHQENLREEERRRLAQCLHDDLGQSLMALKLDARLLYNATRARHPRLHAHSGRVLAILDDAIHSARALINDLHPSTLELGLPAAVDWLLKQQERRSSMHCQLHLIDDSGGCQLAQRETWAVFRMIQEALFNIDAYAKATRLDVSLDLREDALLIVISDNGMRPQRIDVGDVGDGRSEAFGMLALRERVSAHGGELVADNAPGRGTTITIMLPGKEKREAVASRSAHSAGA
ncbi:PAS domain-containing protein [Pseudoduganella sp. LjRoot289]|uniref:PAS domain-containing sensor histidine kinase n=1 Tax=Pseudoduganella sp. LjRoot289 TaxID=3342314 RepID=UPI003ECD7B6E